MVAHPSIVPKSVEKPLPSLVKTECELRFGDENGLPWPFRGVLGEAARMVVERFGTKLASTIHPNGFFPLLISPHQFCENLAFVLNGTNAQTTFINRMNNPFPFDKVFVVSL